MASGGHEEVCPADDFGDLHGAVVGHAGELVGREIVMAPDDEVAKVAASDEGLSAEGEILEMDCLTIGYAEAPVDACTRRDFFDALLAAGSRIHRFFFALVRRLECAQNILTRAGARINKARIAQAMKFGAVQFDAFALVVRCVRSVDVRAFIPRKTEPFQVFDKSGDEFRTRPGPIEIVIAKNQLAVGSAGALLSDPESPRVAEMEKAGGRRGESSALELRQ